MIRTYSLTRLLVAGLALFLVAALYGGRSIEAADGSDFEAGRIIDDAVFYNTNTMSVQDIQDFLEDMLDGGNFPDGNNGVCDTDGTGMVGSITRAQYALNSYNSGGNGNPAPFICLPEYYENPNTGVNNYWEYNEAQDRYENIYDGSVPSGAKSAAQLIYDAAQDNSINPQVLIVLLQKEQSLVTDDWAWGRQYQIATGYGCPDSAPCNDEYYGLWNQLNNAAWQFNRYKNNPQNYSHIAGQNNSVLYHPNGSCGSSTVYIENQATAGLYNYTPYQPNSAALANLYGTGNSCSSYGNRNFWRLFTDWFGSTNEVLNYSDMSQPRWMQLDSALQKTDIRSSYPIGPELSEGQQIYFDTKISRDGEWYLRTRHDTRNDIDRGIPLSSLIEVDQTFSDMLTPRWMKLSIDYQKIHPITEAADETVLPANSELYFSEKISVGGELLLRTLQDATETNLLVIPLDLLEETSVQFSAMSEPRWLLAPVETATYDYTGMPIVGSEVPAGDITIYTDRASIDGKMYLNNGSTSEGDNLGVLFSELQEIDANVRPMSQQRWLETASDVQKVDLDTGMAVPGTISTGTQLFFSSKGDVGSTLYLITQEDAVAGLPYGIPIGSLQEIVLTYEAMPSPRWLALADDYQKINPYTREPVHDVVSSGRQIYFADRAFIGGEWYLRTFHDFSNGIIAGIPESLLNETSVTYVSFLQPRWMIATEDTKIFDLRHLLGTGYPVIAAGTASYFDFKTTVNGNVYAVNTEPVDPVYIGTPLSALRNIASADFSSLKYQRAYRLLETVNKIDLATGQEQTGSPIPSGTEAYFQTLIKLGDDFYLRSANDTENQNTTVINLSSLEPVDVTFEAMLVPRALVTNQSVRKRDPVTLRRIDDVIPQGRVIDFSQKISIDGNLYLRTTHDTQRGHYKVIPYSALSETQ